MTIFQIALLTCFPDFTNYISNPRLQFTPLFCTSDK